MTTKIKSYNIDQSTALSLANVTLTAVTANGTVGANGDVLVSNGSVVYWSSVAGQPGAKGEKGEGGSLFDVTLNSFTGNGSNTEFTLSTAPFDENHTIATIYGVVQHKTSYSISANTITFSEAPTDGAPVEVQVMQGGAKGEPGTYAGKGDKGNIGDKGDKGENYLFPNTGIAVSNGSAWDASLTVPTGTIVGTSDTQTLTNKTITGANSASTVEDGSGTGFQIGYKQAPVNGKTANYTLVNSDDGKLVYFTGTSATLTIPADGSTTGGDFALGTTVVAINNGTANVTVAIQSGGTLYQAGNTNTGSRTLTIKGLATIVKVAGNTWFISGTGMA